MGKGIVLGKRYEVLSKIGAGGMADVYKGRDLMLNRNVAIKVLKKEFRVDESFVEKFRSEAQAAAGLTNPNIVNVYDVGEDRGLNYMVMELVEGITLKEYIHKKGKISYKETISIAIQICQGIGAAHAAGIIHRDIKPQNIIISQEGKVKVTDFGIAKAMSSNTTSSTVMGSVHYTSPEQAKGRYSDMRSDIYSMGITLYEMVTGDVPFDGDSAVNVAMKHLQEELPLPSDIVPDIPYSLEQIILKCTLKNAQRRYPNTQSLIADLKHSLIDPEGDFVEIDPVGNADTVMITDVELDDFRRQYDDLDDDDYDDDDFEDSKMLRKKGDKLNPKMRKMTKILTIVAAVLIALVLIFAVGRAVGIFRFGPGTSAESSKQVTVPDLVGMTEAEAKAALDKLDLGYKITERKESEKYEEGRVISQDPKAGKKASKYSKINIVLSSGLKGKEITVPDVKGLTEDEAQKALNDVGFEKVQSEAKYDDSVEQGHIISTDPSAGSKGTKETTITMYVSKGAEKVTVPSVVGSDEASAVAAIQSAGFTANVTREYSETVAKGVVISQSHSGTKQLKGTTIDVVVSDGPKPAEKITVPEVTGQTKENAETLLKNYGFAVTVIQENSDKTPGTITRMDPGAGTQLEKGATVTIYVSIGPADNPDETP